LQPVCKAGKIEIGNADDKRTKKSSTIEADESRMVLHVLPTLGHRKAKAVTSDEIKTLLASIATGETAKPYNSKVSRVAKVAPIAAKGSWVPSLSMARSAPIRRTASRNTRMASGLLALSGAVFALWRFIPH
jgi:hypothetical protein